jgi:hypothetical protein
MAKKKEESSLVVVMPSSLIEWVKQKNVECQGDFILELVQERHDLEQEAKEGIAEDGGPKAREEILTVLVPWGLHQRVMEELSMGFDLSLDYMVSSALADLIARRNKTRQIKAFLEQQDKIKKLQDAEGLSALFG